MAAPFHNPWFFGHLATLSIRIICTSTCCKQMMSGWYLSPRRGSLWLSCFHNTAAWSWRCFLAIQPITLDTLEYEQPIYKNYIAYVCILYIYILTQIYTVHYSTLYINIHSNGDGTNHRSSCGGFVIRDKDHFHGQRATKRHAGLWTRRAAASPGTATCQRFTVRRLIQE